MGKYLLLLQIVVIVPSITVIVAMFEPVQEDMLRNNWIFVLGIFLVMKRYT